MVRHCHKVFSSLLLVWVFLDIAVPGMCPADSFSVPGSEVVSMSAGSSTANDSGKALLTTDDACFCYCAHMIAGAHFALDVSLYVSPVEAQPLYAALDGPPQSFYHPPRS
jgi:hypothetical protein